MKESLEILGIKASGLDEAREDSLLNKSLSDAETYKSLKDLSEEEKETYLKELLEKYPHGHIDSKLLLADIVKEKDLDLAYNMIYSAIISDPTSSKGFYSYAALANMYNAFDIGIKSIEVAEWLSFKTDPSQLKESILTLKASLLEEKSSGVPDNSKSKFWYTKALDKEWVLKKIYFESNHKKLIKYCKQLISREEAPKKDFEDAIKALGLIKEETSINEVNEYISKSSLQEPEKNYLLGLCSYFNSNFIQAKESFLQTIKKDPLNSKVMLYLSLSYLHLRDEANFIRYSQLILPESENIFNASFIISSALSKQPISNTPYPNSKKISEEISLIFESLISEDQYPLTVEIEKNFRDLGFYSIVLYLDLYLAEVFINHNDLQKAKEILASSDHHESHRIKAWIYRIEGNEEASEKELIEYRKNLKANKNTAFNCKLINIDLPEVPPKEIEEQLKLVEYAYKKTKEIITDLEIEYGLNSMTCIETKCQDCCTKTYPFISYIEYMLIRSWLETQDISLKNEISKNSQEIISAFKEKYSTEPEFIIGEAEKKYYPRDFTFNCPCLGDNKCNIYEVRPFTCRSYAFTSPDGYRFKGCNYFFEQFRSATTLHDYRKILNMQSFTDFSLKIDKEIFGKKVSGPIPLWFAGNHEETMRKVNQRLSSYS